MPTDPASALRRADDLLRQGHRDQAIVEYVKIAEFYHHEGFLPKAAALYKKILKIRPHDETALLRSGEIAEAQGLVADAKSAFLSLSEQRRHRGDRTGAAQLLVRIGALDPGDVAAQRRAAAALLEIDDRPGAAAVCKDLAFHLLKRGRHADAVNLLREAAEQESLGPDAAGPLLERHRRFAAGQLSQAERPNPAELKTIATLLASLGLDEQALQALADAEPATVDAETPPAARVPLRVVRPHVQIIADRVEQPAGVTVDVERPPEVPEEARDLSGALDLTEPAEDTRDAEPVADGARFAELQDLFEEWKGEAAKLESAETTSRELELGEQYYRAGKIDHATRALQMATRSPAQRFRAAALLGRIELERGRAWDAIRWFERATDAKPPSPEIAHELLYDLANTLESVGERERALAVFIELRMDEPHYRDVARRVSRLLKRP
ncbi:MAG: hypothetical protein HY654_13590 [Acidobacteria bacterium]|nr:hypothetical protein [Acidobacteriota bacterium]